MRVSVFVRIVGGNSPRLLENQGLEFSTADLLARSLIGVSIIILSLIANLLASRFFLRGIAAIITRTTTQWDDMVMRKKVFNRLANLAPAIVIYLFAPIPLVGYDMAISVVSGMALIYMLIIGILVLDSFLNATLAIYNTFEVSKEIPIKGFIQVLKLAIYFVGGIFIVSILLNN